jgi:cyclophilin family peptidyl-prolyl cis-trans isomerase
MTGRLRSPFALSAFVPALLGAVLLLSASGFAQEAAPVAAPEAAPAAPQEPPPRVSLQTSMGQVVLELNRERAPLTVANFLRYVTEGHFNNTVIYRVVPRFVIQGGSVGANGNGKPVHEPIPLEANNGLSNMRGTITMARSSEPASATAEFFINLVDNPGLNQEAGDTENRTGYAVFGRVVSGMETVDLITQLPLGGGYGPFPANAPLIPVIIRSATILDASGSPAPAPASAPQAAPAQP